MPVNTSPRVKAHRLRLYEEMKVFCPFGVVSFAVTYNVSTIYLFHSALFVHFNHSGVYLLPRLLHPKRNCLRKSLCEADTQRKSPQHGTKGSVFSLWRNGRRAVALPPRGDNSLIKMHCKYSVVSLYSQKY